MIDFALDILKEVILAITDEKITSGKSKSIRAFISLYDSIKKVEYESEKLLILFEQYVNSPQGKFDVSRLRLSIRGFSAEVCEFVELVRKVKTPLRIFKGELAETFLNVGAMKLLVCRSLMEIAVPEVCFDGSLPPSQQKYLLMVLDYAKFKYSANKVKRQWKRLIAESGIKDRAKWHEESHFFIAYNRVNWVNEPRIYSRYKDNHRYDIPMLQINENSIRSAFGFKVLKFTDIDAFNQEIQTGWIRLKDLREGLNELEKFLSENYSVSDFF